MNLTNLKELARFYLSELTARKASDTLLLMLLNEATLDVTVRTACLKAIEEFNATANTGEYRLSSVLTRFLAIDKEGIWWNDGDRWQELYPRTIKYLNNWHSGWRDDGAGSPQRYALHGDLFIPHPKPETSLTDGFKVHFIQRPPAMATGAHFPFPVGDAQDGEERSDLAILSDCILLYVEWKVLKSMNKRVEAFEKRNEYLEEIEIKKRLINTRADIEHDEDTKMRGPRV